MRGTRGGRVRGIRETSRIVRRCIFVAQESYNRESKAVLHAPESSTRCVEKVHSIQLQHEDTCYLTTRDCVPGVNFVLGQSTAKFIHRSPNVSRGGGGEPSQHEVHDGTDESQLNKFISRGCSGRLMRKLHVPCRVSNVRRMSPRRASVRLKAFKCIHPRTSLVCFVCSGVRFGSSGWK